MHARTGPTYKKNKIHDLRINRKKQHLLLDIIILSILTILCRAESYVKPRKTYALYYYSITNQV